MLYKILDTDINNKECIELAITIIYKQLYI